MWDETANNFKSLSCGRPNLVLSEPIQPLECCLDVILSPKVLHELLCVASVKCHDSQDKLTESSLLDLFGCKSEGMEKFCYYVHQNVC
jgi:hypothetical protein